MSTSSPQFSLVLPVSRFLLLTRESGVFLFQTYRSQMQVLEILSGMRLTGRLLARSVWLQVSQDTKATLHQCSFGDEIQTENFLQDAGPNVSLHTKTGTGSLGSAAVASDQIQIRLSLEEAFFLVFVTASLEV